MIWCPQTGLWVNLSAYILFRLYIRSRYVRQTEYSETVWKYFEISLRNNTEIEYWNMGILIWTPISNGLTFIQPIYWICYVFDSKYPVWKVKHLPALIISNPSCHKLPWLLWINWLINSDNSFMCNALAALFTVIVNLQDNIHVKKLGQWYCANISEKCWTLPLTLAWQWKNCNS